MIRFLPLHIRKKIATAIWPEWQSAEEFQDCINHVIADIALSRATKKLHGIGVQQSPFGTKTFNIIEKFGGRQKVAEVVSKELRPVTVDTVRMWCSRERIPGDVVRCLLRIAERREISTEAADFDVMFKERSAA